jgi:hypothetical protein
MFTNPREAIRFLHSVENKNGGMLATTQAIVSCTIDSDTAQKYMDAELFLRQYFSGPTCAMPN